MKPEFRCVFDTNVIISALLINHSLPAQAFFGALEHNALILSSPDTLNELQAVLSRKKFDRYLLQEEREQFFAALLRETQLVEVTTSLDVCRDPKDNKFLELALSGQATHIISGDEDLLCLHPFRDISILTPHDFIQQN